MVKKPSPKTKPDPRGVQSFSNPQEVKKCTRCRVKRNSETVDDLQKYKTCIRCRNKRKVVSNLINLKLPNTFTNYNEFLEKIKTNSDVNVLEHRFVSESDPAVFKRYDSNYTIDSATYQQVSRQVVDLYINPLMEVTGYRFPIRDYHKGGSKSHRISFMFICSQDKAQQRKSRSTENKTVPNRLKVEECESKLTLSYSLLDGLVTIYYNHKSHKPYVWKKSKDQIISERQSQSDERPFDDLNFVEQLHQLHQKSESTTSQQQPQTTPHQSYIPSQTSYEQSGNNPLGSYAQRYQRYSFYAGQQPPAGGKSESDFTENEAAAQIIAVAQQQAAALPTKIHGKDE